MKIDKRTKSYKQFMTLNPNREFDQELFELWISMDKPLDDDRDVKEEMVKIAEGVIEEALQEPLQGLVGNEQYEGAEMDEYLGQINDLNSEDSADDKAELLEQIQNEESKGLGDTISKITEATGIKSLVHKLFGEDCGCDERQKRLNKLWSYRTLCLDEDEYTFLNDTLITDRTNFTKDEASVFLKIYQRVINPKQKPTNCAPCWRKILTQLKKLTQEYNKELSDIGKDE